MGRMMRARWMVGLGLVAAAGFVLIGCGGDGDTGGGGGGGQTRNVSGQVQNRNGSPAGGVRVRVQETNASALTGGDGRFTLNGVPVTLITLTVDGSVAPGVQIGVGITQLLTPILFIPTNEGPPPPPF